MIALPSIPIDNIVEELGLEVIYCHDSRPLVVTTSDINRPGLQFAGFFDYFASERIQVLGKVEMTYLETLGPRFSFAATGQVLSIRFSMSDHLKGYGDPAIHFGTIQET